jgi:3-phosphoshikimate 1-carboxyvinyltransferase
MIRNSTLALPKIDAINSVTIQLTASKSISNRALVISALCQEESELLNLAEARDTKLMMSLLHEPSEIIDVLDAGTTMRFLTGYFTLTGQIKVLTGTPRMQERPIGILVDALRKIGGKIEYLSNEGYPPHKTLGFSSQKSSHIEIPGDVSSQYISSLLMMAPILPKGLQITMKGKIMSRPYIKMTLGIMERFGVTHNWDDHTIDIPFQKYQPTSFYVEADWSAASYWYSMVALSNGGEITLLGLEDQSLQGDRQIAEIMRHLGVETRFHDHGLTMYKGILNKALFEWDFSSCPDLGPTVMATCAALDVPCQATGLESLRIKETDRILALQNELGKIGATLDETAGVWKLCPSARKRISNPVTFSTYDDHRMAMALAPLSLKMPVIIEDPGVVRKSYPGFWEDLALAGLKPEA